MSISWPMAASHDISKLHFRDQFGNRNKMCCGCQITGTPTINTLLCETKLCRFKWWFSVYVKRKLLKPRFPYFSWMNMYMFKYGDVSMTIDFFHAFKAQRGLILGFIYGFANICVNQIGHHWFKQCRVPCSTPSYCKRQCWFKFNMNSNCKHEPNFISNTNHYSSNCF